jgi:hypothetical protein
VENKDLNITKDTIPHRIRKYQSGTTEPQAPFITSSSHSTSHLLYFALWKNYGQLKSNAGIVTSLHSGKLNESFS